MGLRKVLVLAAALIMGLGIAGCSGFRNYGQILPDVGVDRDMETATVHPELRYFISGSDVYPNALIGLHRDYRLDAETHWKEIAMTPAKLREMVYLLQAKAREFHQYPYGFDLLDPTGKKIGFWYSIILARTYLRFEGDGTVMIQTPELETYEKLEQKDDKD
ncbi:MAG: hypothetical protein LLG97_09745 [Deltaproteobacteria bacterium]|nr:hypothetical protein [Deltaproteobacteria bacterium]